MFTRCRARHRLTTSPIRFFRPRRPYRRLALSLLTVTSMIAACSKHNPTKAQTFTLSGRVRLEGTLATPAGDSIGVQRAEDADSVLIYLYQAPLLKDSTRTTAGGYAFTGLTGGSYSVAANLWGGIGDTVSVTTLTADAALDTLVLLSSATMPASPNPFSTTDVIFAITATSIVELSATKPSGMRVKTMISPRTFPAGIHAYRWDGTDDASNPLPSGLYWVLFKAGPDYRARLVAKS